MTAKPSLSSLAFPVTMLLTGIYYAMFTYYVPFVGDDYLFMRDYLPFNGSSPDFDLQAWWNYIMWLRDTDNSRSCNALYMVLRCFDSHTVMAVAAGTIAMMMCVAVYLTCLRRLRPTILFICIIVVLFPWRENTIATINYMNTMLSSAVTLLFLHMLIQHKSRSTAGLVATALFSFLAATVHEGYSTAVCVGMFALLTRKRFNIPAKWWVLGLCYAAGMIYVATSPGIMMRASDRVTPWVSLKGTLTMTMPVCITVVTFICAIVTKSGRSLLRRTFSSDISTIIAAAFLTSLAMAAFSGLENPRALWIPCLFATAMLVDFATPLLYRRNARLAMAFMVLPTMLFAANQVRFQRNQMILHDEIDRLMAKSPHGTVFHDYHPLIPRIYLMQPVFNVWFDMLHLMSVNLDRTHGNIYGVVAESLAGITSGQATAINNHGDPGYGFTAVEGKDGWWYYGNEIVAPDTLIIYNHWTGESRSNVCANEHYDIVRHPGEDTIRNVPMILQKFVTSSGDSLLWIHTSARGIRPPFASMKKVR